MAAAKEFPARPIPAVGAVVFRGGEVLLVKRGSPPNEGRWSLPGGVLEVGETVESGVVRETIEETGVLVRPIRLFEVGDFIEQDQARVRWHYVLVDVLCAYVEGEPRPATDVDNARFVPLRDLDEYDITSNALEVVRRASIARDSMKGKPNP